MRAAVVPEVAHVRGRVVVRRSAAHAVLRVRGVGEALARAAGSSSPKRTAPRRPRSRSDERVVSRSTTTRRRRVERRDRAAPALRDDLELPVAVELVAEEVAEEDRARRSRAAMSGNAASSTSKRPSSASRRARSVEATPETRFAPERLCARRTVGDEDLRDHRGRRRLPVRPRDECAAAGQARGQHPLRRTGRASRGSSPGASSPRPGRRAARAGLRAAPARSPGEAARGQSRCPPGFPRSRDGGCRLYPGRGMPQCATRLSLCS